MDLIVESEYVNPLIVAEVIADQKIPNCKESFEQLMCNCVSDKAVMLKVLTFAKSAISEPARKEMIRFRDTDWDVIRQNYLHRNMRSKVQEVESLFVRIGI